MVSVIVVSYNTRKITLECLRCLYKSEDCKFETVVIDNNSTDGSAQAIEREFSKVKLIKNRTNPGFGIASNQGMRMAGGEYFLLLNSDAFVQPDTLARCGEFLEQHPDVGVVGCKLVNSDGGFQMSVGYFPTLVRVIGHLLFALPTVHIKKEIQTGEVDWVTGAFMLLRKEVFTKTQGFDEKFFMYGEEVEWQYRIYRAGYKIGYFADARAVHLGGASTKDKASMFAGEMQGYKYWFTKYGKAWERQFLPWIIRAGCLLRLLAFSATGNSEMARIYARVLASVRL